MSLPEAHQRVRAQAKGQDDGLRVTRRAIAHALFATVLVAPILGACGESGFRPLYGSAGVGAQVDDKFAKVQFSAIPGRVGQMIRNELIFQSTGGGHPVPPEYRLDVAIRETVTSTLVQTDGNSLGQIYSVDASFQLIRLSDNSVALKGISYGRAGFERFDSIFSNVRAQQDAENRAARTVGEELRTRLTAFLASQA